MIATELESVGRSPFEVVRRRGAVALTVFLVVAIAAFAFVVMHKVKYGAIAHVLLVSDPTGRDPNAAAGDMATIITGSTVLLDVRQRLGLSDSITDLRKAVNARVAPKSSLMTIAVQNRDPELAMSLANTLAATFVTTYRDLAGSRYDDVTRRLKTDVEAARLRLGVAERRLERASSNASYVGSQSSLDATAAHLGVLMENRGVALAQLVTDRANLQADREQPGKTANIVRHEILMNNSTYRQTEAAVGKDVSEYTTTRAGVTKLFPGITGFADKVAQESRALDVLRSSALTGRDAFSPSHGGQIVQTARDGAAVDGDTVRLAALDDQIRSSRESLSNPPGYAASMGMLRAERDAGEAQLQALTLRFSNAQANSAEATSLGEVVIVDRATEARPTLIGPTSLFALGLLAAAIVAVGAAYLAESLVPRLLGAGDVEGVYGRPILATLRPRRGAHAHV